jgi:hypothetical protein
MLQEPVTVYKAGHEPCRVWSVDLNGFLKTGWMLEAEILEEAALETALETPTETPELKTGDAVVDPKAARRAELKALLSEDAGWQSIKEIANKLDIHKKPKGGWDEAIDVILAIEFEA